MTIKPIHRFLFTFLMVPLILVVSAIATPRHAQAAAIEWTLNNAVFTDGGVASGSFVWDNVANDIVSWNLSVSGGVIPAFSNNTFSDTLASNSAFDATLGSGDAYLGFVDSSPSSVYPNPTGNQNRQLRFGLTSIAMLDTPAAMLLLHDVPGLATNGFLECFNCSPFRIGLEGAYLSSVPVPAAVWLFGTALVAMAGFGRRRKAA